MKRTGCLIGLTLFLGAVAVLFWIYASQFHPEWLSARLRAELGALPVRLGQADEAAVRAAYGTPLSERRGPDSLMMAYPGITLRLAAPGMKLQWVEVTTPKQSTGQGLHVGHPWLELMSHYGRAQESVPFQDGFRYRYRWGMRYTLDFWVDARGQITKYQFWAS
jgi:hypothetical protein